MNVAVLFGGRSDEFLVSLQTAACVSEALARLPDVRMIPVLVSADTYRLWSTDRAQAAAGLPPGSAWTEGRPVAASEFAAICSGVDVVFPCFHGRFGEDGSVQGFLETLRTPYVGSGVLASAVALHKAIARLVLQAHGIAIPRGQVVTSAGAAAAIGFPCFVKPESGGSSIGVHRVLGPGQLADAVAEVLALDGCALIEEAIPGREFSCAVMDGRGGRPVVLPPVEILPGDRPFFDYESKYVAGLVDEVCPAGLADSEQSLVEDAALRSYEAIGCRHFARVDMILGPSGPVVLEVNTLPGMTPTSLVPKAAAVAGISFPSLVAALLEMATRSVGRPG